MTRLIILVTLFLAQYARSDSESVETVSLGSMLHLKTEPIDPIDHCKIITSNGKEYSYAPGSKVIPGVKGYEILAFEKNSCHARIYPVMLEHAGVWQIMTYTQKSQISKAKFTVVIEEKVKTIPSEGITVQEGLYAHASIAATLDKVKTCEVTSPSKEKIDLLSSKNEGIRLFGKCGFLINAKPDHNGTWSFRVTTENNVIYTADAYLQVLPTKLSPDSVEIETIELTRGGKGTIAPRRSSSKFCQLINPQGEKLPMIDGSCIYEIPVVTDRHAGVWIVRYPVDGQLDTVELPFRINVTNSKTITCNVSYQKKGEAKISCTMRHRLPQLLSFCRFTRPDGNVMNASPGVGSERYIALTSDEEDRQNELQCALLVRKVEKVDYGSWKCEIFWSKGTKHEGSIVYVDKRLTTSPNSTFLETVPRSANVRSTNVYVKKDDPFTVKCTTDTVLDYCWLRSPNGTAYSVSSVEQELMPPFTLPYQGAGLTMGECGAKIDRAAYSDHGEWTCHVGVADGREEKKTLSVYVTDSYLIAGAPLVEMNNGRNTTLSCRILPTEKDRAIHYCRWIRPDGYGIYNGVTHRYATSSNKTQCRLVIQNDYAQEDVGVWMCIAGVSGTHVEELAAFLDVRPVESMGMSLTLSLVISSCVLLSIAALVVMFLGIQNRYRQRHAAKQPPPYSTTIQKPPKSLNPDFVRNEFKY